MVNANPGPGLAQDAVNANPGPGLAQDAQPGTIVFDFEDDPPGTATPFSDTEGGITATFASPADPGGFSGFGAPGDFVNLSGNMVYDPGPAGASFIPLIVSFSKPVSSVSLNFATDDFFSGASTFTLQAFSGGLGGKSVGFATAVGTPLITFPEGLISFSSGGRPFDTLQLSTVGSAPYFAVDNIAVSVMPAIAVTAPSFDDTDGGVDFSYTISGADLPQATTVALYWSPVSTFDPTNIGQYTQTYSMPTQTAQSQTPYSVHVEPTDLTTPPPLGTKYLLAVIDPDNQIVGFDETNNVASVASPPAVVNVITHGFNPLENETTFLAPFVSLGNELDNLPHQVDPGSALDGQVKSYVDQWDSTSGWVGAIVSVASSLFLPFPSNALALESAELFMNKAASNAEQAAQSIAAYITNPQNGYLISPVYDQAIDLIGHSRGAAVNARVSQLLNTEYGYTVDQYTSLDGYSTDWPFPSNILGDISITDTATADRKVNYEVQQGLGQVLAQLLEPIVGVLPEAEIAALILDATSWRAPDRAAAGFEDDTILGSGQYPFSNHINVVQLYENPNNIDPTTGEPYLYDNYEGQNLDDPPDPSPSIIPAVSLPGIAAAMSTADVPQASASAAATTVNYSNFTDGSFKTLGMFWNQLEAANISTGGNVLLNYWLGMVDDPTQLLASTWTVTGDAKLVQDGDSAVAELDQTTGTTSIGQYLELDSQASSIGFDMSVLSANPGDQLQVLFNNNVLGTFDLSSPSASGHETVSLAGYASQMGEVSFQLVGPAGDTAKVQLDNLTVNEANAPLTIDPIRAQSALAGTTLVVPVTANDSAPGRTITYSLDPGGASGATIDPNSGVLTWDVPISETPGDYPVTVRVTDNGSPSLSVTTSFTVTVGFIQQPTNLSTVSGIGTYDGAATLTATLASDGSPLAGKIVSFTLNNGGNVTNVGTATTDQNGVATLTGVSLAGFNVGTSSGAITASFAGDSTDEGTSASGNLTVNPAQQTPTITWNPSSPITYGTALGATQLDATATVNGVPVSGTFAYTPDAGTVLQAGLGQPLNVIFTPDDTVDFATATGSTTLDVLKATPTVNVTGADVTYDGNAHPASATITGVNGDDLSGLLTVSYVPSVESDAGPAQAGTYTATASFGGDSDYNPASASATVQIAQATPTITWPNPASITYGTPLGAAQLDATANVSGAFAYSPAAGTVPSAGNNQTLSVYFTPTDSVDYTNASASATINVAQATPTVTWPNPANITYGTPLGAAQLDATANVSGAFTYTPAAGTVLSAGNNQTLSVYFTPTDTSDYTSTSATATINVAQHATTTTLAASTPEGAPGQTITFTASVAGGLPSPYLPTGSVQFQINGVNVGSLVPLTAKDTAPFSTTEPASGSFKVTAVYSADANFTASTSPAYTETVLSPGVYAVGTTLYVVGANTSDYALISPWGSKLDGSTGLAVVATLNNAITAKAFNQTFTAIDVFGYGGNDSFLLIPTLTLTTTVVEGNGNNYLLLAGGNDSVTLGSGSNRVFGCNGNKTITASDAAGTSGYISLGNGNENIQLGAGNNTVSLGNGNDYVGAGDGNDNVKLGNGSDVIVEGNGNDHVSAGNGSDLVVGGLGQHTIQLGNGNDILIDGSATVVNSGDSLRQILSDWNSSSSASVNTRLKVVYNTSHPNVLKAGSGRDWFFFKYSKDVTNKKSTDRLN